MIRPPLPRTLAAVGLTLALLATSSPVLACIEVPAKCSVTSVFGPRFNPITKNYSTEFHHGVDFGCPLYTPVFAADGGTVTTSGYSNSAGNWVVV